MRVYSSRLLLTSLSSAQNRSGLSTKAGTRARNHYDTLEIDSGATQSEIKSAYFKLSKQYHPDKNNTEEATVKFRNITEAYEILGSFSSRRTYDRSILTHTQHHARRTTDKPQDSKVQFYQSQMAEFRQNPATGSTPIYDFDAWTKAHYGTTLRRTLRDRTVTAAIKRSEESLQSTPTKRTDFPLFLFALLMVATLLFLGQSEKSFDVALTIRERSEIEETAADAESRRIDGDENKFTSEPRK